MKNKIKNEEARPRRSYLATLNINDYISPTRKSQAAGVNILLRGDGFVWTKIFSCYNRIEAVKKATVWLFRLKSSSPAARERVKHVSLKDLTVDDSYGEVFFYKKFRCYDSNNRLLEEEKINELIEDSCGKLRKAKLKRKFFSVKSSVEWNSNAKRLSYREPPLKGTGYPLLYVNPEKGTYHYKIKKQSQKTVGTKYEFDKNIPRVPMPRQLKSGKKDGRTVWSSKSMKITAGKKTQELLYKTIRLKSKTFEEAILESKTIL